MSDFFPYAVDLRLAPFWLPFGLRRSGHPALTVTVTDVDGLAARLRPAPDPA